jgi:hypothetical protein
VHAEVSTRTALHKNSHCRGAETTRRREHTLPRMDLTRRGRNRMLNSEVFAESSGPTDWHTGSASGREDADSGAPPANPREEKEDRCAGRRDLLGAKPALTLAVPQVSPPKSPTSSARHAPYCRFWIEKFLVELTVFGGNGRAFLAVCELVKNTRSLRIALQMDTDTKSTQMFLLPSARIRVHPWLFPFLLGASASRR